MGEMERYGSAVQSGTLTNKGLAQNFALGRRDTMLINGSTWCDVRQEMLLHQTLGLS